MKPFTIPEWAAIISGICAIIGVIIAISKPRIYYNFLLKIHNRVVNSWTFHRYLQPKILWVRGYKLDCCIWVYGGQPCFKYYLDKIKYKIKSGENNLLYTETQYYKPNHFRHTYFHYMVYIKKVCQYDINGSDKIEDRLPEYLIYK